MVIRKRQEVFEKMNRENLRKVIAMRITGLGSEEFYFHQWISLKGLNL